MVEKKPINLGMIALGKVNTLEKRIKKLEQMIVHVNASPKEADLYAKELISKEAKNFEEIKKQIREEALRSVEESKDSVHV